MRVAVPGTCGELVQGTLDGVPCLVSCPIALYSVAAARSGLGVGWSASPHLAKTQTALRYGLQYLDLADSSGRVDLTSDLPHGRGYGSSTADIGATLFALGHATGRSLSPAEAAQLALRVEPTDGSLFPGWILWDHIGGQICDDLGAPPLLSVIILDPGGEVDTVAYNRQAHAHTAEVARRATPRSVWPCCKRASNTATPQPSGKQPPSALQRIKQFYRIRCWSWPCVWRRTSGPLAFAAPTVARSLGS